MNRLLTILSLILLIPLRNFGQTDTALTKVDHYKTNNFDVAIFPAKYNDLIPGQRFTPTRLEIDVAEFILLTDLKTLNKPLINQSSSPIIHKNLNKYKRQYFGYIDKNGDRILLINCFWSDDKYVDNNWLNSRIYVLDGGSYFWSVKFNLNSGRLFDLDINGYA
jgi:hypothetical protein